MHYPVQGGRFINIVAIVQDDWQETGWSAQGQRAEILRQFARWSWAEKARDLLATPERWTKWALYDRKTPFYGGVGPVTLIGDAAHPMLPFMGQGAAMAIEDGVVLGRCFLLAASPMEALVRYEAARLTRGQLVQAESAAGADRLQQGGPATGRLNRNEDTLGIFAYDPGTVPV